MKTQNTYKSFNRNKTIEELQYIMFQYNLRLQNLETDLNFMRFLVNSTVFNTQTINLFETLEHYKIDIDNLNKTRLLLIDEVKLYLIKVTNKIECEDIACDSFFIKNHETLESDILSYFQKISKFKEQIFQYLQSVI